VRSGSAVSIESAISNNTMPPPTRNAGKLVPNAPRIASPAMPAPASTPNTASAVTRAVRLRSRSLKPSVSCRKSGIAASGSTIATSAIAKREYSGQTTFIRAFYAGASRSAPGAR
jgi:hypothetical protein